MMHDDDTWHESASSVAGRSGSDAVATARDGGTPLSPGGSAAWFVPDAYIPPHSTGNQPSHESVCILNATEDDGAVVFEAYFEHAPADRSAHVPVAAQSCVHLRTDEPEQIGGLRIPRGVAYGLVIRGTARLRVQYSRLDTTQAAYALMTLNPTMEMTP